MQFKGEHFEKNNIWEREKTKYILWLFGDEKEKTKDK